MTKKIIFTNTLKDLSLEKPVSSDKMIPDWYKKTNSYIGNKKIPHVTNKSNATIKKCIPVFDAITSGYIIKTTADMYISKQNDGLVCQSPSSEILSFHPLEQAELHPYKNKNMNFYLKFMNPWSIKTPKGYSCLFVEPMHQDLPINVFPGVVDTDKYFAPVNIIFSLKDPNFEGYIYAGTPIVQVIPFKRDYWEMNEGKNKDLLDSENVFKKIRSTFYDRYKNSFWEKKQYR
jgi:hypothetical protein